MYKTKNKLKKEKKSISPVHSTFLLISRNLKKYLGTLKFQGKK